MRESRIHYFHFINLYFSSLQCKWRYSMFYDKDKNPFKSEKFKSLEKINHHTWQFCFKARLWIKIFLFFSVKEKVHVTKMSSYKTEHLWKWQEIYFLTFMKTIGHWGWGLFKISSTLTEQLLYTYWEQNKRTSESKTY